MNADGLDISLPLHFLSEVIKYDPGDNILQWTCLFNTHLCNIESRIKKTDGNETMLCLSVSKPGKRVNCSNALQIIISNVHKNDEIQCSIPDVQTQNNCLKRKRGRPRKSDSSERNQVTLLPETNGKRYSLRGVRIAESIMNAEKGIDGDINSLEAHSESGNQVNKHISRMHKDLNHMEENEDNLKTTLGAGAEEESRNEHGLYQHSLPLQECSEGSFKDPTSDGRISNKQQNKSDELDDESDDSINDSRRNTNYCQRCRKTYKNFQTLRNHIKYVHKTSGQQNHCKMCPAKFKHMSVLKQHIDEIHNKKISFTCAVCKKEFARRNQYNRHMLCHSEDKSKRLKCPHCEKRFSFNYNLTRHIELVHKPSTESFHCSYCGKGFNLKAAMVSHVQQVHFNIYPFQCSVDDCKMGFSRQKHLLEHMQQSHSDVAFKTEQYKRGRFKYGRTDEDLFFCSHCRISFCYKAKLVEHMHFAHNNAFPFVCSECSQGFVEKTYLLHHLKHAHNQIVDDNAMEEAGKEDAEVSEDLDEEKAGNYKIIMVDEAGEVLQICQPINTETSATLEVPGKLTNTEETVTFSYSVSSENHERTTQFIIQPGSDQTAIIPQEIASLLLSGEQTIITQESRDGSESNNVNATDNEDTNADSENYVELTSGTSIAEADEDYRSSSLNSNSFGGKHDQQENNPQVDHDADLNTMGTDNVNTEQFSSMNTYL